MRIALAVIAGPDAIEDGIERMLKSVEGKVDGVFVAYTGSNDGVSDGNVETMDAIEQLMDPEVIHEGALVPVGWHFDFSQARNASFELVNLHDGEPFDYIIWLDCDDVLPEGVDLQAACTSIALKGAHGGFVEYQYEYDVERDKALVTHFKERIFRADVNWRWVYPIHENCIAPFGVRMTKVPTNLATVRHLRGKVAPKRDRNKHMIRDWFQRDGNTEPRAVMFMAHETYAAAEEEHLKPEERRALYGTALKLYQRFISLTPANEDVYTCNRQCADILAKLGRFEDAINIDLQGIKMEPRLPASYVGIAMAYHSMQNWELAIKWAQNAMRLSDKFDGLGADMKLEGEHKPLMIISDAKEKLGDLEGAHATATAASLIYLDDWTRNRVAELSRLMEAKHYSDKHDHKNTVTNRERLRHSRPEKSICIFVPPTIEDWNPDKLKHEGLGGTETSIIKLANELAHFGWRIAIFGQPGTWEDRVEDVGEGRIEWYRSGQWHPDEEFTVFIGLRIPQIFDSPIKAKLKILWLHDVNMGDVRYGKFGDRFSNTDIILTPSQFHIKHLARVYRAAAEPWDAGNEIIFNGFDYDRFKPLDLSPVPRDSKRVMYASSPDRGLLRLLDLWPKIAEREPNASLNIYYGWDSIDAVIEGGGEAAPPLARFKQTVEEKIEELKSDGYQIFWYGRISETRLARHMRRSGVMAYPANFMETFGIVFAQAMAAGVIPVVPDLGFLPQLVGNSGIVVKGSPDSMDFGDRFADAVYRAMNAPDGVRKHASESMERLDWKEIGAYWDLLIHRHITPPLTITQHEEKTA